MVIKAGDTVVTKFGKVGVVTLTTKYSATEDEDNSYPGSVFSVTMAHDPSDPKIYVIETNPEYSYSYTLNAEDCGEIKTISRKKEIIVDFSKEA